MKPSLRRRKKSDKNSHPIRLFLLTTMNSVARDGAKISLHGLREHHAELWSRAYEELWKVAWRSAKRKLPYDTAEELEDLISQVVSREIVPQILEPTQKAFQEADSFDDLLNLTSRIISNRAIDEIRRRMRRPESQNLDQTPELEIVTSGDEVDLGEDIQLALNSLDARYRDVIEDFYFEELNTEEIAKKRGRPKGSICSDLVKARKLLGSILNPTLLQSTAS